MRYLKKYEQHNPFELINAITGKFKKDLTEIRKIINSGDIDINQKDFFFGKTALMHCIHTKNFDVFKELIKAGADLDILSNGETALHMSLSYDYVVNAKEGFFDLRFENELIDNGANVNLSSGYGETPLMRAAFTILRIENIQGEKNSNLNILKKLIEKGAKWDTDAPDGRTFLDFLSPKTKNKIIEYIKNKFPAEYEHFLLRKQAEKYNL